jgi:RNA polymerase sigma factor (sigma-70 family)
MTRQDLTPELERLHAASFSWALSCCRRDREEAEEVLQTSYLKVLEGRAQFDGRSSFKTFLFGVIRRTAAEQRRRRALHGLWLQRWGRAAQDDGSRSAAPPDPSVDRLRRLDAALALLPRRQREVIELRLQHEMTIEAAAGALAISVGSARVHYARAKERLRQLLAATAETKTEREGEHEPARQ